MAVSEIASPPATRRPSSRRIGVGALIALLLGVLLAGLSSSSRLPPRSAPAAAPATVSQRPQLPDEPSDDDILRSGVFADPLVPVKATTPEENRALGRALVAYGAAVKREERDGVEPLLGFLAAHADSAWRPGLLVNLGTIYRRTGHFSKAFDTWQTAWNVTKDLTDPRGHDWGDLAVADLSQFEAYLGRKELLKPLLEQVATRPVRGTSAVRLSESRLGLNEMVSWPARSFRCGPMALLSILNQAKEPPSGDAVKVLRDAASTPKGLSLTAVRDISEQAGMNYRMAFRSPGAATIVPSVAHWKLGHYAALLAKDGVGHYQVEDRTFGEDIVMTQATLEQEASGYFLVPPGDLPAGWRLVEKAEGDSVWGRGDTGISKDPQATGPDEIQAFPCRPNPWPKPPIGPSANGCTDWNVEAMVVGLSLHDTPVGYTPPVGPDMHVRLWYSQLDAMQPASLSQMMYTNFGLRWTFNWLSYVTDDGCAPAPDCGPDTVTLYREGGGGEQFSLPCTKEVTGPPTDQSCVGILEPPASSTQIGQYSQSILTFEGGEVDGGTFDAGATSLLYTLQRPDGSTATYTRLTFGAFNYFMTALSDPQGNTVTIHYDPSTTRIMSLNDAIGQTTTVCYSDSASPCAQPTSGNPYNIYQVTQIIDPFNRSAFFQYDSSGRLTSITDVLGITSTYTYATTGDIDTVTSLQTPYGITTFTYGTPSDNNSLSYCAQTDRFVQITEPLGRTSRVESCQDPGDPSTQPNTTQSSTTPPSPGAMAPSDPGSPQASANDPVHATIPVTNINMQFRNTFIWNPVEYNEAVASAASGAPTITFQPPAGTVPPAVDYTKAKLIHWLHEGELQGGTEADIKTTSRVPESTKEPLENRVWFFYQGQPEDSSIFFPTTSINRPTTIARLLPTNASEPVGSEIWDFCYGGVGTGNAEARPAQSCPNANMNGPPVGQLTYMADPVGRARSFGYATNNIDLITILDTSQNQNNFTLASYSYTPASTCSDTNTFHTVFAFTGANGQSTGYCPQPNGQPANGQPGTITPPGGAATVQYNYPTGSAYVQAITAQPPGSSAVPLYSFGLPDDFGRIDSVTDATGMTYTYAYDAADRVTAISFSDGTSISYSYNSPVTGLPTLDLQSITDELNHTTTFTYDAQRVLTDISSANRQVSFAYAADDPNYLQEVLDPRGYTTFYVRDLEGHLLDILNPSAPPVGPFVWDAAGRLTKDPQATYTYNLDGTVNTKTYASPSTPAVTYGWDPAYRRLTSVSSSNATMSYQYYPTSATLSSALPNAGLLESVTTTFANLPNVNYSTIPDTVTYTYDANNRVLGRNVNGTPESFEYDPLGRLTVDESYLDYFQYYYSDATPRVSTIEAVSNGEGLYYDFSYGNPHFPYSVSGISANAAQAWTPPTGDPLIASFRCANYYENGQGEICGDSYLNAQGAETFKDTWKYTYSQDALNQLTSASLESSVNFSSKNPISYSYAYDPSGNLNSSTLTFASGSPSSLTPSYTATNEIASDSYDRLGDMTAQNGSTASIDPWNRTFTWDAAQRPVTATYEMPGMGQANTTTVTYDGLGRVIRLQNNGSGSDQTYLWCGNQLCLVHDNTQGGEISRQYFAQGFVDYEQFGYYYFLKNPLGSVTGLVGDCTSSPPSCSLVATYPYDSYGHRLVEQSQTVESDIGFGGYLYDPNFDAFNGLNFAQHRAYLPSLGRWLSRDPIALAGGINQYTYAGNDPINNIDPSGLTYLTTLFFWDFVTGQGPTNRSYAGGDPETQEMADSPGADALRNAFYQGGEANINGFDYGTLQAAEDTLLNPYLWGNTATQVGGFAGATAVNNGDGTVTFSIPNIAGSYSFFYHQLPDRTSPTGPFRNINQTFTWTEGIDSGRCTQTPDYLIWMFVPMVQ